MFTFVEQIPPKGGASMVSNKWLHIAKRRVRFLAQLLLLMSVTTVFARSLSQDAVVMREKAKLVLQVKIVHSTALVNRKGDLCAARYMAEVVKVEKGRVMSRFVMFALGEGFESGERLRVYLDYLETEQQFFKPEKNSQSPTKELPPSANVIEFLNCPGVLPGWVPLRVENLANNK
jgi:hypothetical protein